MSLTKEDVLEWIYSQATKKELKEINSIIYYLVGDTSNIYLK